MGSRAGRVASGVTVAMAMGLSVALTACGGEDEPEAKSPATPTSAATPSASPGNTAPPLSKFEDQPPVQAARQWAELVGRAVNKGDRSMRSTSPWATPSGVSISAQATAGDVGKRYSWPGPQPFTPVGVVVEGGSATMNVCFQTYGWALDGKGRTVNKRKIEPAVIKVKKVGKRWKVDSVDIGGAIDCSRVKVAGVKW